MADRGVHIREAREEDVPAIKAIFQTVYGADYPYPQFFDEQWLKRSVFGDDMIMLVAVTPLDDAANERVVGTASIALDVGAHADLLGELGRLAVHPDARGHGLGKRLMRARLDAVRARLHVAIVENRTAHMFSQRVSESHGLHPVGFLPLKHSLGGTRESVALYAKYFEGALALRRNHPRVVPEAHPLAHAALAGVGIAPDVIVDEDAAPYPPSDMPLRLEMMTALALPALLRIERGRIKSREVFGPMRLHYGFFELSARHAQYLVARHPDVHGQPGAVAGALGFIRNERASTIRVFELIVPDEGALRPLLEAWLAKTEEWGCKYADVDVSAHAARLQRTLVELGFRPAAYVPAMVFHEVERLDVIKMVRLCGAGGLGEVSLTDRAQVMKALVWPAFETQRVQPRIAAALDGLALFEGLTEEQRTRVAGACVVAQFADGATILVEGQAPGGIFIVLEGEVEILLSDRDQPVGHAESGETLGELGALTGEAHSATVRAKGEVVAAKLDTAALQSLVRQRPDIGVVTYRNLAVGLGRKLQRVNRRR